MSTTPRPTEPLELSKLNPASICADAAGSSQDFEQAARFLTLLDETAERWTFQTFDDDRTRKDPAFARVLHGTLKEHWQELCELSNRGAGVFITVNETNGKGRKTADIIRVRAVLRELDRAGARPLPPGIEPHLVVESSPGKFHEYLLIDGGHRFDLFEGVMQRLVDDYDSDPAAKDRSRVLRLPGFPHQKKTANPWRVRLYAEGGHQPYTWEQVTAVLPPKKRQRTPGKIPPGYGFEDLDSIKSALAAIPPDCEYQPWLSIGMALHHASGGGVKGFTLWDDWSAKGEPYRDGVTRYKWGTFGNYTGSPATLGTLFHIAQEYGWKRDKGNGHDHAPPDYSSSPESHGQGADGQEPAPAPEESPVARKVREIVESGPDPIAIEQGLRALRAELKEAGKPVTLKALQEQGKKVQRQRTEREARCTGERGRAGMEARSSEGVTQYSLHFAVAGQQPQSKVAAMLTRHNTGLAYDHVAQKWLQYVGTQWKEITDTAAFRIVQQWIDAGLTDDEGYTASFANGVIVFLKALLAADNFDEDPRLVPFQNGVLDLSSMTLMPHSPTLKISWCLPFDYDPTATCEPVIAWLMECVDGDPLQVELLRAYIKAILTGRADLQRYVELLGPGGTGKGEFIRLCSNLVGKRNVHVTAFKHLEENRFETARLHRKRLCVITDAEKYSGDVSTLKAMTGQDDLRFEEKHKQAGECFKFQGMVLIGANQEITSSDYTSGMQRRRITMRFDNQVDPAQRRDLEHEFEPYLPGVIAWALALDDTRMKELLVETDYHVPTVGGFNLQTLKKVNPLAAWADECLILAHLAETPVGSLTERTRIERLGDFTSESKTIIDHADEWLYPNYVKWCRGKGNKASSSVNFTGLLKDLLCHQLKLEGIEKLDRAGAKLSRFKGIRLRIDSDQHLSNLLFGTRQVRVKYGLGTGRIEQSTGSTDKSKFSSSDVNTAHNNNGAADPLAHSTRTYERSWEKNPTNPVPPVLSVPVQQNQAVTEMISVPDPYQVRTEIRTEKTEAPPATGTVLDPLSALAHVESAPPLQAAVTSEPVKRKPAPKTIYLIQHPDCRQCRHFRELSRTCVKMLIGIAHPTDPVCRGQHFQPKEGQL